MAQSKYKKGIYVFYPESWKQRQARHKEYYILAGAVIGLVLLEKAVLIGTRLLAHLIP